jgi:anaerobic selenocysteine-containing dehydrogenase
MKNIQIVSTICRMCPQGCGLEVTVDNGIPVSLKGSKDHPYSQGWLCPKGRAALDLFHSPHRLSSPLIRKGGKLISAEWDEALDYSSERLHLLRDMYGPQALAIYQGEGIGHQEIKCYMKRFANVYGTPNFMGVGSICNVARTMADTLTFGGVTKPDIANTRLLIIWGANPFASNEPFPPKEISKLKKRGGKIIVVDPRRTEVASKSDVHLAIKPGHDEILVLNMLHVILGEDLWDKKFTEKWVEGFNRFQETVVKDQYSPENGEELTGIPCDLVRQVARSYAKTRPACISMGNGLEHHSFGTSAMRLLAVMKAIMGNLDIPGGDLFTPRPKLRDITMPLPEPPMPPVGSEEFRLFCQSRKEARALSLPKAILKEEPYPINGLIIAGGNPSLEWPQSNQTREALEKLEFLMVIDVVRSPDSQYADVILPACTFLERDEHQVNVYQNLHNITLRRRVVEPAHGLPDQMIWVKLAHKMGFGEHFPWQNCEQVIDHILSPLSVTYGDLVSRGGVYQYEERRYKKYENGGFHTPSGKVEIYSERLKRVGYDPSPIRERALQGGDESNQFPLHLTTGSNLPCYLHWQYRYIPKLRKMAPEPLFEIHPNTALQYGVSEGEMAEIQTKNGKIQLKAYLTDNIRPDTIHIPQGWEEACANELTPSYDADPISGFPNLKSLKCTVSKIA